MSSAKGKGSSRRKGKEIASDNPTTKTVGEDAPLSELKHFDEEEKGRNPSSKCASLIDPWFNTHAHFPKVSAFTFAVRLRMALHLSS